MGIARAGRQSLQCLGNRFLLVGLSDLRHQQVDPLSDDFRLIETEHSLAGWVECLNDTFLIDREDDVLDVIEDDLQVVRALLAGLVSQRPGFIGHQAHRLHDAPSLVIDGLVLRTDQAQQHDRS